MSYAETEYTYGFSVKSNSLESAFRIFVGLELTEIRRYGLPKPLKKKEQKLKNQDFMVAATLQKC